MRRLSFVHGSRVLTRPHRYGDARSTATTTWTVRCLTTIGRHDAGAVAAASRRPRALGTATFDLVTGRELSHMLKRRMVLVEIGRGLGEWMGGQASVHSCCDVVRVREATLDTPIGR